MSDRIRIGIIGTGGIADGHVQRLLALPEAEIVALCDISDASIERTLERQPAVKGLPVYKDYRELLEKETLDAVQLNTPHTVHFQQIMDALDAGLHVLTEKPMVCSVAHAHQVLDKAEAAGKTLAISYQRHFSGSFRYMRERLQSGEMGSLAFLTALQGQDWRRATAGTWRQDPALSGGGQLNDSGSHLIDIILWITGLSVSEVFALVSNRGAAVDVNSAISLRFENGAQGTIAVVGDSRSWCEDITIWGENGTLYYRNGKLHQQMPGAKAEEVVGAPALSNPDRNFIYAILGREEVQVPGVCGLRVMELTEAAWRSAELHRPVKVERSGR